MQQGYSSWLHVKEMKSSRIGITRVVCLGKVMKYSLSTTCFNTSHEEYFCWDRVSETTAAGIGTGHSNS